MEYEMDMKDLPKYLGLCKALDDKIAEVLKG